MNDRSRFKRVYQRVVVIGVFSLLVGSVCACMTESIPGEQVSNEETGKSGKRKLTTDDTATLVKHECSPVYGDYSSPMYDYVITVTGNELSCEYVCTNSSLADIRATRELSAEEKDEIYDYFAKSHFLKGDGDYNTDSCDGAMCYFIFTLEDGTQFTAGGLNPDHRDFGEAEDFIRNYVTKEMSDELQQEQDDFAAYAEENRLCFMFSSQMDEVDTFFMEEQLQAIGEDNLYFFFCNMTNISERMNHYYEMEESSDGTELTGNTYKFVLRENNYDVYIGDELVATVEKKNAVDIYEETMNTVGAHFTEEQLRSVDAGYMLSDLNYIAVVGDYTCTKAVFDAETMTFSGEGYSIVKNSDQWHIYIGEKLAANIPYQTLTDLNAKGIEKYKINLSEEELMTTSISYILSLTEKFESNRNYYSFTSDDQEEVYTVEGMELSYVKIKKHKYKIIYKDKEIGQVRSE